MKSIVDDANVLQFLPAHLYWLDRNNVYLGCNELQAQALNLSSAEEIVGKQNRELLCFAGRPDLAQAIDDNNRMVMSSGEAYLLEESCLDNQGNLQFFITKKVPIKNSNNVVMGLLGISIDITPQKNKETKLIKAKEKIEVALQGVVASLPGHVYCKDVHGKYLACSDSAAKNLGFESGAAIIGKTDFELPWPDGVAAKFRQDDIQVMQSQSIRTSEKAVALDNKTIVLYGHKVPLRNKDGRILGVVGVSLDIADQKEREKLLRENHDAKEKLLVMESNARHALISEKEKLTQVVGQIVHDIQSPLSSLQTILQATKEIPESNRIALRNAIMHLTDMTNQLLHQYVPNKQAASRNKRQTVLVSTLVSDVVSSNRYKYKDQKISFTFDLNSMNIFSFVKADYSNLHRAIVNIINNAIDALVDTKDPEIKINLSMNDEWVMIKVLDNGRGVPENILDKINKGEDVTYGKKNGHGLGLSQVRDMIIQSHGKLEIYSSTSDNPGTTVCLNLPRVLSPDWIKEDILLYSDDIVVILDDDTSIHSAWDIRFTYIKEKISTLNVHHFYDAKDTLDFINQLTKDERQKVYLLSDYELIGQELNGLEVVKLSGVDRKTLVTSHYDDVSIRKIASLSGVKILPKPLVYLVNIRVSQALQRANGEKVQVHMVFVDDEQQFTNCLISSYYNHLLVDQYSNPVEFVAEVDKYSKDTKIILDNYYFMEDGSPYQVDGLTLAEQLHKKGYTNLVLLSGEEFQTPNYLKVVLKTDHEQISTLDKL